MRYKIVACILILSVFSFVLAAPIPVRKVREVCTDTFDGGENMIIVSGKRALKENPYDGESDSDTEWWTPSSQSPASPDHAGGSNPGVGMSSSPSSGSESPLGSKVWSAPGGTKVPLDEEGAFKPGTTTEDQSPSSSGTKSVSWGHTTKVHFFHDGPEPLGLAPPPGREGYLAKVAGQKSPSPEVEDASLSSYFEPPPPPPPKPQSKGSGSKFKTFFGKLGKLNYLPTFHRAASNFKTLFGKLGKLNFRPRSQRTVDTGA